MKMTWFRLYHDLPNDRKLRKFTPQQKWAWVVLLCLASESKERGFIDNSDEDDLADYCGFESTQDFQYFLDKLRQKDMIEPTEGRIRITHWEDRQYEKPSDKPEAIKARVAKHRAKKKVKKEKPVTPCNALQTQSNADETPEKHPETHRSDTDTEQKKETPPTPSERGASEKGNSKKRQPKKPAEVSKYHPELCEELFQVWQGMYVQTRGAYEGRKSFCKGFDGLIEQGAEVEKINQGLRFYAESKLAQLSKGEDPIKPPDAVRFFLGKKDHPSSYCLDAYELKKIRENKVRPIHNDGRPTLTPEQHQELCRIRDSTGDLSSEEMMLITPGLQVDYPNWENVRFFAHEVAA